VRVTPIDGALSLQLNSERGLRTYWKDPDGGMRMPDRDARVLIKEGVAFTSNAAGPTAHIPGGFVCARCGRRNYFRRCGACGEESQNATA
jgi:hypothetical protein